MVDDFEKGNGEVRVEQPTESVSPDTSSPAAIASESSVESAKPDPKVAVKAPSGEVVPVVSELPAYTPNYKVKVMDQEHDIPEEFRGLIKDEKTQEMVHKIFEKAYGLDFAKPKHEATQHTLTQLQSEHNYLLGSVQEVKELYQRGDLDAFFDKLAIPPQRIMQYALDKLNYQELPPEQRAMIDGRKYAERQNYDMQRKQREQQGNYEEQIRQARQYALNSELARPEVKSIVDTFDQRAGRPGAFYQEVVNRGQLAWVQSNGKVDLTPGQAIEQVVSLWKLSGGSQGATPASVASPNPGLVPAPASAGNPRGAATIPNVGGGKSSTPLKQKPRSIEDLKKLRDQMAAG